MSLRTALALAALLPCAAEAQQAPACDGLPGPCIEATLAPCHATPADAPALASQCYRAAQDGFSGRIAARMQAIRDSAPDTFTAIAGIEVKYDLLLGLAQCDRMEELALLGDAPLSEIQRRKDGCTATAAALAWQRLVDRSRDMPQRTTP